MWLYLSKREIYIAEIGTNKGIMTCNAEGWDWGNKFISKRNTQRFSTKTTRK